MFPNPTPLASETGLEERFVSPDIQCLELASNSSRSEPLLSE